jgi:hypothetical protein
VIGYWHLNSWKLPPTAGSGIGRRRSFILRRVAVIALAASFVPAPRASSADPMAALRQE